MPPYSEYIPSGARVGSVCDSPTPDGIPALQPSSSFPCSESSECADSNISGEQLLMEPRPRTRLRRSRSESMRAGSKEARDFFGLERLSKSFTSSPSTPLDLSDTSVELLATARRPRRSRIESIQAGSKGAMDFFGDYG